MQCEKERFITTAENKTLSQIAENKIPSKCTAVCQVCQACLWVGITRGSAKLKVLQGASLQRASDPSELFQKAVVKREVYGGIHLFLSDE